MKSLIYEIRVETEEYLLARIMAASDVGLPFGDRAYHNIVRSSDRKSSSIERYVRDYLVRV